MAPEQVNAGPPHSGAIWLKIIKTEYKQYDFETNPYK